MLHPRRKPPPRDFLAHPGVFGPAHYLNAQKRHDLMARFTPAEPTQLAA